MYNIPECFYRVSVKGLVYDETGDTFLLTQEKSGIWELPGGGLEWGATPHEELSREIQEEMGLSVRSMAEEPSYFLGGYHLPEWDVWILYIVYAITLEHLNFTKSDECFDIAFVTPEDALTMNVRPQILELANKLITKQS